MTVPHLPRVTGDWLTSDPTQRVFDLLEQAGFETYVVGGCVRNALLQQPVHDIDMATNARPQTVLDLAKGAGIRAVPTGIDHGTVTLVMDGTAIELTTYRRDVATDGRRAVVAFSDNLEEDAHRRDFTINALYADRSGHLTDVVGGLPDIASRRIRFIDDAAERIREDYLRILRFFRFAAWYGDPAQGMDADALAAIAGNLEGLPHLSRERVTSEVLKLCAASDPAMALSSMVQCGVMQALLGAVDLPGLHRLLHWEASFSLPIDPILRLAGLGLMDVAEHLRLSRAQERQLSLLLQSRASPEAPTVLGFRHGASVAAQITILRAAAMDAPVSETVLDEIARGAAASFPVSARDLMPAFTGPDLGARLQSLEDRWIASDFTLGRDALLNGD